MTLTNCRFIIQPTTNNLGILRDAWSTSGVSVSNRNWDNQGFETFRVTRNRGGLIYANSFRNAVDQLWQRLKRHSKKMIEAAFRELVTQKIYRYNEQELGYQLMAA